MSLSSRSFFLCQPNQQMQHLPHPHNSFQISIIETKLKPAEFRDLLGSPSGLRSGSDQRRLKENEESPGLSISPSPFTAATDSTQIHFQQRTKFCFNASLISAKHHGRVSSNPSEVTPASYLRRLRNSPERDDCSGRENDYKSFGVDSQS